MNTIHDALPVAFGLGQTEMIMIVFVIVLLFGAKRIPELGRSIGSGLKNFKKGIREGEEEDEEYAARKALPKEQKDAAAPISQSETQQKVS